jgi:hypothetical protein
VILRIRELKRVALTEDCIEPNFGFSCSLGFEEFVAERLLRQAATFGEGERLVLISEIGTRSCGAT